MFEQIRKRLHAVPFVPFTLRAVDGQEYAVPTTDHLFVPPAGSLIIWADDRGVTCAVPIAHISGILAQGAVEAELSSGS